LGPVARLPMLSHGKAAAYFDPCKFKIERLHAEAEQARREGREFQ
jgi:hypothetical protein